MIWVVVSDTGVFARSVRGNEGRWYRDLADGRGVPAIIRRQKLAVQGDSSNGRPLDRTCQVKPLCSIQ